MEIMCGAGRRRTWSTALKEQVVSETLEPGVTVTEVARRHDVDRSLLYRWRRAFGVIRHRNTDAFLPVEVATRAKAAERSASDAVTALPEKRCGLIEIDLGRGRCVRVGADVDSDALSRVLDVLERR